MSTLFATRSCAAPGTPRTGSSPSVSKISVPRSLATGRSCFGGLAPSRTSFGCGGRCVAWRLVGAGGPRFFFARPQPEDPLTEVGGSTPDEARIALASARAVSDDEWREGADLWMKFASPSPLAFDEARRRGSSLFPELTMSAELHGAWFPRLEDRRLQLSQLDELLLGAFDDSWRTTFELLPTLPPDRLARLVGPFDAFFSDYRLRAWATQGVLEREALTDQNPFAQDRFRATDRTRALLDHGLDGVGDAPQLYVGGCVVHDAASPWVRIEDDSGWRLALQGFA